VVTSGFLAQRGWTGCSRDAMSARLQAEGVDRLRLIGLPKRHPADPGKIFYAQVSIYGARDAGRDWHQHLKDYLETKAILEPKLEHGVYRRHPEGELKMGARSRVGDLLVAGQIPRAQYSVTQAKAIKAAEQIRPARDRRNNQDESAIAEELSTFRNRSGLLQKFAHQSRLDTASEQNSLAQRASDLKVKDLIDANMLAQHVKENMECGLAARKGVVDVKTAAVLARGGSPFANAPGEKGQAGAVWCLTKALRDVVRGQFDKQVPLVWASFRVERTARFNLVAEAYSISEAIGRGQFLRQFLRGLRSLPDTRPKDIESSSTSKHIFAVTGSDNFKVTVNKRAADADQVYDQEWIEHDQDFERDQTFEAFNHDWNDLGKGWLPQGDGCVKYHFSSCETVLSNKWSMAMVYLTWPMRALRISVDSAREAGLIPFRACELQAVQDHAPPGPQPDGQAPAPNIGKHETILDEAITGDIANNPEAAEAKVHCQEPGLCCRLKKAEGIKTVPEDYDFQTIREKRASEGLYSIPAKAKVPEKTF
ncbi:unnamed protein product, partial [Prorocentrum cordatum]